MMKRIVSLAVILLAGVPFFTRPVHGASSVFDNYTSMTISRTAPSGYQNNGNNTAADNSAADIDQEPDDADSLADDTSPRPAASTLGKFKFKNKSTHCIDVYVDGEFQGSLNPPNKIYRLTPEPKKSGWVKTTKDTSHKIYGEDCANKNVYWGPVTIYLLKSYSLTFLD